MFLITLDTVSSILLSHKSLHKSQTKFLQYRSLNRLPAFLWHAERDGSEGTRKALNGAQVWRIGQGPPRTYQNLHFEDIGFARVDHARAVPGFSGSCFRRWEDARASRRHRRARAAFAKRYRHAHGRRHLARFVMSSLRPNGTSARLVRIRRDKTNLGVGSIAVVTAGTSDIPIAEEAALTAETMGNTVDRIWDVGVAGIHRVLSERSLLQRSRVVIVAAGMEGALPSVVGGLVGVPVVAVPTSIGYGASFGGVAALLGMLNSCASNVTVVNIDNGFGAGFVASLINRRWAVPVE